MIHVCNLKIEPFSTFEEPWRFETLVDAVIFSRISFRPFYAAVVGDTSRYQIWPGGRVHEYQEHVVKAMLERNERVRATRKKKAQVPA
jgi:hypothetical protein